MLTEEVLGRRVRAARADAGLTQEALAQAVGVDQPTISRVENGRDLSSLLLAKIAYATGKSVDFFLREEMVADPNVVLPRLRTGEANAEAVQGAIEKLSRFVDDYEFLLSIDA